MLKPILTVSALLLLVTVADAAVPDTEMRRGEIRTVEQSMSAIADRGAALFFLARRYAQVGDSAKALALLKECMSLDEGFDPSETPQFETLRGDPQFATLARQAQQNYPPVHRARPAYTISERDLFPEGLAVDPASHVFYMGTARQKIVKITAAGIVTDLAKPTAYRIPRMNGLKVDPSDHSLWVATADELDSELLHVASDGTLLEHLAPPGPAPHELNDLVLHGSDDIYVTDTLAHQVYRYQRKRQAFEPLTLHRSVLYPNGIALSGDGKFLYIADILGMIRLDLSNNTARDVGPGKHSTLAGIDGLYWYKGSLIGVQYGNGRSRVARWLLTPDGLAAGHTDVFEYRTQAVTFPTTGAIVGSRFYFMENTGLDNYKDGKVVDPQLLQPIHIAVLDLE